MRNSLILVILLFLPLSPKTAYLEITHDTFIVDDLDRIQVLSNGNLDLYDSNAKAISHHSESLLGRITSMDRVSALKLLVFYADIPAFQILDNTLSPHSELYDLNSEEMGNITSVCMSANNTFWGYDGVAFELVRFDDSYRILSRSGNTVLTAGHVLDPVRMTEHNGRLYVADSEKGLFIFDQFGTFERMIPFEGLIDMDIEGGIIYLSDGTSFERVALQGKMLEPAKLVLPPLIAFDIVGDKFYYGDGKKIYRAPLDSLFN